MVILTSTSKTHHKSQIGKTQKHHSPKKKKNHSQSAGSHNKKACNQQEKNDTYRGQTILLTDFQSSVVKTRRHWNSQKTEKNNDIQLISYPIKQRQDKDLQKNINLLLAYLCCKTC